MEERKGWFDWRAVRSILIALTVAFIALILLAFVAQRLISPGSGHSSGTTEKTVKTTSTLQ